MKEERLIGNSGIQEVRQQCLDLLAEIRQSAGVLNDYFEVGESNEYLDVFLDLEGKVILGLRSDGAVFIPKLISTSLNAQFKEFGDAIERSLTELRDNINSLNYIKEYLQDSDNLDWLRLILDSNNRIVEGISRDGTKVVNIDTIINGLLTCEQLNVGGVSFEILDDPNDRREMILDPVGRIISYRKSDGTLVENSGVETPFVKAKEIVAEQVTVTGAKQTDKEYIYVERPKFGEIRFYGSLPTDTSEERIPTNLDFMFKVDDEVLISAKCTLAIQGHGSAGYSKKGYTFEPYNANGDALEIKFGNMIATDSFHLKAFATDQTHARDIGGYKVWERMVRALDYPYNKVNNIPFEFRTSYKKNLDALADAQYHPDGFPNVVYLNDEFLGLYTLRLKKTRQNYAMEKSVKSMIFLDATNYNVYDEQGQMILRCSNLSIPFDHRGWDLKNPKLKNYEEGGEITDAGVLANIERLFNFTSDLDNQYLDYEDYIVLPHWLVYIITEELLFSEDSPYNNMNLLTWDATHWTILPYDLDLTYGLHAWTNTLYDVDQMDHTMLSDIFPRFKQLFDTELKALYTKFRQDGIITVEEIMKIYRDQIKYIPREVYEDDFKKWGSIWLNGNTNIEHINRNVAARIEYLDSIWLNNN